MNECDNIMYALSFIHNYIGTVDTSKSDFRVIYMPRGDQNIITLKVRTNWFIDLFWMSLHSLFKGTFINKKNYLLNF